MSETLVAAQRVSMHFPTKIAWPKGDHEPVPQRMWRAVTRMSTTVQAVTEVDLEIARGETLGLVGESGCGKSTLARLIVGLCAPTRGTIRYEGTIVSAPGRGRRNRRGAASAPRLRLRRQLALRRRAGCLPPSAAHCAWHGQPAS